MCRSFSIPQWIMASTNILTPLDAVTNINLIGQIADRCSKNRQLKNKKNISLEGTKTSLFYDVLIKLECITLSSGEFHTNGLFHDFIRSV